MKVRIFALLAIVMMLFAACSPTPQPATEDDIAVATAFMTMLSPAIASGNIERDGNIITGDSMTLKLTSEYKDSQGNTLTGVTLSLRKTDSSFSGPLEISGVIDGKVHTMRMTMSYSLTSSSASGNLYIDGRLIDPATIPDSVFDSINF